MDKKQGKRSIKLSKSFTKKSKYKENNGIRLTTVKMFAKILIHNDWFYELSLDEKELILNNLERGCYNYTFDNTTIRSWTNQRFIDNYCYKRYQIASNLDKKSIIGSDYLVNMIEKNKNKKKFLKKVAYMSSKELCPEKYSYIEKKIEERKKTTLSNMDGSSLYKCFKCKSRNCKLEKRYNRSLDECVNMTVTCLECGFEWNN